MAETKPPKVFISYAWETDTKIWVREFATRLRFNGVETILDQWDVAPGDSLPEFMESSVSASDFVLVVCTPAYKRKSDSSDPSGVGYEKGVITGELFVKRNQRKFIPILRKGKWLESAPSWVLGKNYIDLRNNPLNEGNYQELLKTLYGKREPPPPVGKTPEFSNINIVPSSKPQPDPGELPNGSDKAVSKPRINLNFFIPSVIGLIIIVTIILFQTVFRNGFPSLHSPALETLSATITTDASLVSPESSVPITLTPAPTPSITPTGTSVFIPPETGYTIVDPADVFKLVAKTDPFGKIAKEEYTSQEINSINRTLFYTIDGTPDQPMQWRWYWCATTEEILKQNVNGIDVVFQADGRLIPHEQLAFTTYSYTKDNGGTGWCATYSTVIKDWKPGVYHFIIVSTLKSVINDGEGTFLPGFQISDFTVKIHEPALKTEVVDDKGVQMALVQGSSFQMGGGTKVDQQPIHAVYLDSYYIDAYEVSNASYKACVDGGVCLPPKEISSTTHPSYYTDARFNNYPMVNVTWSEAETYCKWRDARLPTEAEWEKAARGVGGRTYPWGNLLECTYANYLDVGGTQCFVIGDTTPVDKYVKGVSPFGVYGLVGNVWEWVSDWYSETYYSVSPVGNPQGADLGEYRVIRGGSWKDDATSMMPTIRNWYDPGGSTNGIGFRCAKDVP